MFSDDFFILAFLLQFLHNVLRWDQDFGILLQQLSKVLEQGVLRPEEVKLEEKNGIIFWKQKMHNFNLTFWQSDLPGSSSVHGSSDWSEIVYHFGPRTVLSIWRHPDRMLKKNNFYIGSSSFCITLFWIYDIIFT